MKNFFDKKDLFFDNFKEKLTKSGIPNESIEKLAKKIEKISYHVDNKNKNILLVGNIQSGKTNSFLGLISYVFDNKEVNFSLVFGGVDTTIYEQNSERIKSLFKSVYTDSEVKIFSDKPTESIIEETINLLSQGKKVIFVILKNFATIKKWGSIVSDCSKYIKGAIIIDDEGDQFSQNNIKKIKDNEVQERTATNREINEIFKILENKRTFVSITATPYAHILLNEEDTLKPDYAFLIEKGVGYTSLNYFMNQDNDFRDNFTRIINTEETEEFFESSRLGKDFGDAILTYLVHALLFVWWSKKNHKIKDKIGVMLINPSRKKIIHDEISNLIEEEIMWIKNDLKNKKDETIEKISYLIEEFNLFYKSMDSKNEEVSIKDFLNQLEIELNQNEAYDINIVNSDSDLRKAQKKFTFYVGCSKLSRGVTIPSLITTFHFIKESGRPNMDTISQSARWLGYREEYIFFITVYLSSYLYQMYNQINFANGELFNILEKYESEEKSIKDLERKIYVRKTVDFRSKATRETVSKQSLAEENSDVLSKILNYQSFFIDQFFSESSIANLTSGKVKGIAENIVLKKFDKNKQNLNSLSKNNRLRNCPFVLYKDLREFKVDIGFNNYSSIHEFLGIDENLFKKLIEKNKNKKVILALVQDKNHYEKIKFQNRVTIENRITDIPVGSGEKYIGDRNWMEDLKNKNYLIFQIYPVKINQKREIFKMALIQNVIKNMSLTNNDILVIEGIESN